ncbi:unnamed protein product [Rotaria magnacalcarata]|uniref:Uncharacterized protein n=1 Tax=Rotaria magnacalcarata TaxID=392030 RepID=A0A8S2TYM9_9BILA|nr:unnamed protein product [Rotaria magnacalcarata]CAF4305434.1 unnamed protein product [Rotaria magnacalcarata]
MAKYFIFFLCFSLVSVFIHASQESLSINPSTENVGSFKIEGKIIVPPGDNALENTRILIDEGLYIGIPQVDGTFVISGMFSISDLRDQSVVTKEIKDYSITVSMVVVEK